MSTTQQSIESHESNFETLAELTKSKLKDLSLTIDENSINQNVTLNNGFIALQLTSKRKYAEIVREDSHTRESSDQADLN